MGERGEYEGERDMQRFWAVAVPRREPATSRAYLPGLLTLVVLSTPFYWGSQQVPAIVWGLPTWVWVAVICSAGVSALTAWAAIARWDDREPEDGTGD